MEDRSSNLMTTGFARDYHMHGEIAATSDGKIVGVRVDVIADHGAFNATAQPTKYPAGFFHIFTGSYDYGAAHCKVTGVYTNKAPGGVAYACSFRITEAVYLIERIVDRLADELGDRPRRAADEEPVATRAVPVHDADRLGVRLRRLPAGAARGDAHRRLRRAAPRAGGATRRRQRRPAQRTWASACRSSPRASAPGRASTWTSSGSGMADGCELRVHPTGKAQLRLSVQTQGQGHETTFAQIVAHELGIPPEDVEVIHGDTDNTPFGLGTYALALDAGVGRRRRGRRPAGARQGPHHRRRRAGVLAGGPRVAARPLAGQRRPGARQVDRRDRHARPLQPRAARRGGGPPRRPGGVQPAEPHVPVRRLHLRRRRRPGHR